MTGRERELAAIRHEVADRIPVDVICIETVAEIAEHLGIEPESVYDALGIDGRIISAPYVGPPVTSADGAPLTVWGTPETGDYGTARWAPLAHAESVSEVEAHPRPSLDDFDFAAAHGVACTWGDRYALRGPYWLPLFCRVCDLFGMEEAMVRMAHQPAVFEAALDVAADFTLGFCERLMDACGDDLPILCLGDDFATQRGLMISPADWRRFLRPRYEPIFAAAKRRGKVVWFHSCGDITSVLGDLIDIGVDVWETVQLHCLPMSPERLKREFGRHLTFFGGVNTQRLPFVSPPDVRREVLDCIRVLGEGGGYICGPDHHIKPDVPAANTMALFGAATSCAYGAPRGPADP